MIEAKVIEDSMSPHGARLTTFQLRYPRFIHSEFMTHRVFSRNASSSRAIPVAKMIEQVRSSPAMPIHWGANQPGMQADQEIQHVGAAMDQWRRAAKNAADVAEEMMQLGLHKQVCNRLLEPFQFMSVVVTATEWANFFELRDHPMAEPNIQVLAREMREVMGLSIPVERARFRYDAASWHLPYVLDPERLEFADEPFKLARISTARCARVSYLNHDGTNPDIEKDLELAERLIGSTPMHASPCEHQAYPAASLLTVSGNFRGWSQYRQWVVAEAHPLIKAEMAV